MKKIILTSSLIVFVLFCAYGIWTYFSSKTTNIWNAKVIGDIPVPVGYSRVESEPGSYADYLRNLPLKSKGTEIMLYTGGKARMQFLGAAIIDQKLLSNYEQCADVTMRLRAEYLWKAGKYNEICFRDVNKNNVQYNGGSSRKAFEKYMRKVYGVCSTYSVYHETKPRAIKDVQPGDVFVYPARCGREYGHAVIVVDVAKSESGKVAVMCVEGNTPARDQHIVRNYNSFRNPWFLFDGNENVFWIGPFHFYKKELRHYF